jgi:hypothetical protein
LSSPTSNPAGTDDAVPDQAQNPAFDDFARVDRRIDVAVCLAAFLLGLALVVLSSGLRQGSIPDPIGPGGWPKLLGAILMTAMGANIARRLVSWRTTSDTMVLSDGGKDDVAGRPATVLRPAFVLCSAVVWMLVVRWSGFIVATTGFLMAGLALMDVRSAAKLLLVPILFALTAWLLFGALFGVRLPAGPLEHGLLEILPGLK